ncbi:hypothetical protein PCC6912_31020 [Chlorogloeopsis fritschii PCC 6912]|uniref:Co-chaperone DjlA N-terminal domain-containing protein n=2 Tax=Chlorogloeopsis fritschii TaxID=1124 RepID=A0A433NDR0_CHLFR|nr:hypothetical protein PCC6912_31020 [Chlorogloeopsis fritschii PCC 6912]
MTNLGTLDTESLKALYYLPGCQEDISSFTAMETLLTEQTTMDSLDKMSGIQSLLENGLSPEEAFTAITLAATASDGYPSQEEARAILSTLSRLKLFRSYSNEMMSGMLDKLLVILRREGINALFNTAKESLPHELREAAFVITADLVLADGIVTQEEQEFLNDLYQALGVTTDIATQAVQVMLIKNRG